MIATTPEPAPRHGAPLLDVTATVAHRIAQMTPEQRAQDALDLVARARARLAEWRQTIEHEPVPPSEDEEAEGK